MQETLHNHHTSISISGWPICILQVADDIDFMGGSNFELQDLTNRLVERVRAYGMEVGTGNGKTRTNRTNNIGADIGMNGYKLEEVIVFKYLGAALFKDGTPSAEIRISIASAVAAMARPNEIWQSFESKFKLYTFLVTSILHYGCETWTLLADSEK